MKTLIFVPYDDPNVVAFYCSNMPSDFALVFVNEEITQGFAANTIACVALDPKESTDLSVYVAYALTLAHEALVEEKCDTVVCLMPYAEFIEVVMTEISITVPENVFFQDHIYDSYDPGDIGFLFELRKENDAMTLRELSQGEMDLLPCAN